MTQKEKINLSYDGPFCVFCQTQNPIPDDLEEGEDLNVVCISCGKSFGCAVTTGEIAPMARRALKEGIRVQVKKE